MIANVLVATKATIPKQQTNETVAALPLKVYVAHAKQRGLLSPQQTGLLSAHLGAKLMRLLPPYRLRCMPPLQSRGVCCHLSRRVCCQLNLGHRLGANLGFRLGAKLKDTERLPFPTHTYSSTNHFTTYIHTFGPLHSCFACNVLNYDD